MQRFFQLLKSYMQGTLSWSQERKFRHWLDSKEGKDEFLTWVDSAYADGQKEEHHHPDWKGEELFERMLQKKRSDDVVKPIGSRQNMVGKIYRVAAVIFVTFLLGSIWYGEINSLSDTSEVQVPPSVLVTKQNAKGQKSRFVLPDSSIVFLNADSRLTFWQNFAGGREVNLVGEAFFEVKSDSLNPFVVKSPRLSSVAIGTSFTVSAYPDLSSEMVVLATGKILVENTMTTEAVLLAPGEGTVLKRNSDELSKVAMNAEKTALWTEGILHFDKVPWNEVILRLERWYDVSIKVSGSGANPLCSGSFQQNEYLNNVLQVLGHSIGFSYSINGKQVTIHLKS